MGRLVMKFGGTSVANIDRIRNVARHVKREVDAGHDVAVVVSAMSGKTNELVAGAAKPRLCMTREYDAIAPPASRSLRACSPSRCRPSASRRAPGRAGRSRSDVRCPRLGADPGDRRQRDRQPLQGAQGGRRRRRLPGHQPADQPNHHAGRGGSDTSAVAIAAAIHADRCDIYTDVDGVYHRPAGRAETPARQDRVRGCWNRRPRAPRCCGCARWNSAWCCMPIFVRSASTSRGYRPARQTAAGHADLQRESWKATSSPASPSPRTKRRFPSARSRTSRASPRRSWSLGGCQYQRRHDRAERSEDSKTTDLVHGFASI